jgi:hypothetical protein
LTPPPRETLHFSAVRALPATLLIAGCLGLSLAAAPARAQSYYDVEIVVFELLGVDVPSIADEETGAPTAEQVLQEAAPPETPPPDARFEPLPPDRMLLTPEFQRLRNSKQYRPLLHLGWRQQVLGPRQSVARPLLEQTGAGSIDGLLRVYSETFIHIDLDLTLHVTGVGAYRLNDSRRVRSGETHYFDHPRFGVLLRLTPS